MTRRTARPGRAAFTLVELLIVVVIIALLAALLLAGISKVQQVGRTAVATNDISTLSTAAEQFKQAHGFFPPSSVLTVPTNPPIAFRLPATLMPSTNAAANAVEKAAEDASFLVLKQMYPRWNPPLIGATTNIDWASLGMAGFLNQNLDGNQSMVLFLGGPSQNGWGTDGPRDGGTAAAKRGPYFDFKQDRLDGALGGPRHFLDPFKNPPGSPNGTPFAYLASISPGGKYMPTTPCFSTGVFALCENPTGKFINQGGVQILSAGEDGQFGQHTANTVFAPGQQFHAEGTVGADDLANFNNGNKLGVGR